MPDEKKYDVIITGAGPVGLFLGARLSQLGLSYLILEKRHEPSSHSRSIGIHPPSLEFFDQMNLTGKLLEQGVCITHGLAYQDQNTCLGTLNFNLCDKPHQYVLSLPQYKTETMLEDALPYHQAVIRGTEVISFQQDRDGVQVEFRNGSQTSFARASYLIGCDGKKSIVREKANIKFHGGSYPYYYAMGDFNDQTTFGSQAAIYLGIDGLVESFPLPNNKRRWVAEIKIDKAPCTPEDFIHIINSRTGHQLDSATTTMFSNFNAEHYIAGQFRAGRVLLAGDAAHLVSPIGGQGMNLGWMDVWELAWAIKKSTETRPDEATALFETWEKRRIKSALRAIKRSEINMALGQQSRWPLLRATAVKWLLRYPFNRILANQFTMRGLA